MRKLIKCWTVLLFVSLLGGTVAFSQNIRLPARPVTFYADGGDLDSFFHVVLSDVPLNYAVHDDVYPGYCVTLTDRTSPTGLFHPAQLYDSLGARLPAELAGPWDYVNFILNHKQGVADDVQAAIWYFTDGFMTDFTPAALAMIADATANGRGFRPKAGGIIGVLVKALDDSEIQTIIIEVPVPPTPVSVCDDFVTGGGWILTQSGEKANFGVHGGIRKGAFWGGLNYIDHGTGLHVKSTGVTGYTVIDALTRQIKFIVSIGGEPGTATVTVTDNGEPGTHDIFQISLSTDYSEGGELGGTVKRGGGGNIQLHKSRCKDNTRGKNKVTISKQRR